MRKILLFTIVTAVALSAMGCSQERRWSDREREELRRELRAYRDMIYLENLAEAEFNTFSGDVVEAIEIDYPVYTTFIELPGRGDTVEVYVVSTIVEELKANPHNMRNIYPYPYLVEEGILPAGLNHQAQRAFYECFSKSVKRYYPSTQAFFNAVVGDSDSQQILTDMQMQCAADLFDWGIEIDETVVVD
ncbi:MAG: hypothetical protein J6Q28_02525 [Alistipes sp.]|nr:hypothetical protein [Alistipes sp.]